MSELEEKLGAILSNQEAMSQIMALARNLGGGGEEAPSSSPPPPQEGTVHEAAVHGDPAQEGEAQGENLLSALGNLDPRLISMVMRLAGEYNSKDDRRAALLNALRPFVRPERYAKLDKAIQISKLTRMIRIALDSFRQKGGEDGHV